LVLVALASRPRYAAEQNEPDRTWTSAMAPLDEKPDLPVEIMITVGINVVLAVICYYTVTLWAAFRG
jgi:hypothetical protein